MHLLDKLHEALDSLESPHLSIVALEFGSLINRTVIKELGLCHSVITDVQ